jgi:hypothetical protein
MFKKRLFYFKELKAKRDFPFFHTNAEAFPREKKKVFLKVSFSSKEIEV